VNRAHAVARKTARKSLEACGSVSASTFPFASLNKWISRALALPCSEIFAPATSFRPRRPPAGIATRSWSFRCRDCLPANEGGCGLTGLPECHQGRQRPVEALGRNCVITASIAITGTGRLEGPQQTGNDPRNSAGMANAASGKKVPSGRLRAGGLFRAGGRGRSRPPPSRPPGNQGHLMP
jgi:hypothetical protein